jgi:phosphonoacetaldehyde hydrolase
MTDAGIRLVIFDWAGTTVDFGCFAPVAACIQAFGQLGINVSSDEARGPMGLHKRDHLRAVLELPNVAAQWQAGFSHPWSDDDLERLYHNFLPVQGVEAVRYAELIPGAIECISALRSRGIVIGTTTGYPRAIGQPVADKVAPLGYRPDHCVFTDDVPAGRPAPWMIFRNMEALGIYPPAAVVKIGDTVPDIEEGKNAGAWSIGVTETGSELGLTLAELERLPVAEKQRRLSKVADKLLAAGAHGIVRSVAELPTLIEQINGRLRRGERP